ncbi:MAG: glycosyl hydrolase [Prolixibacteraceae bacterium]
MSRLFIFISLIFFLACHAPEKGGLNPALFLNPPENVKLHAYWQWIDGCVTQEGITRDLEEMKKQGISQVAILCVSMFEGKDLGIKKVKFASNEWFNLFRWTLKEANRLGIYVGMHNCNGWSGSAGPWITPEMSMKKYTWTSTTMKGGKTLAISLQKPLGLLNFYRDVAVVAMKSTEPIVAEIPNIYRLNGKTDASALCDGSPISHIQLKKGDTIHISNENGLRFNRIAVTPYHSSMWGDAETFEYRIKILVRSTGSVFKTLAEATIKGANKVAIAGLPETTANEVLLVIASAKNSTYDVPANFGEVELLGAAQKPKYFPEIPDFLEKAAFSRSKQEQYFSRVSDHESVKHKSKTESIIPDVFDLTSKMDSTGLLRWDAPEGNWTVFRFGYTTTGAVNNPVPSDEAGLECDKMDTLALNLHFRNFPEKLISEAEKYTGNTFKFLLSDSYECSYMNWTKAFPLEFEKRTGYSITPWIPVLCGASANNNEENEAFLYDFRKVIASLIEENYYKHLQTLCHRNKLEFHAEVIYGNYSYPPLEILRTNQYVDLPMTEFWTSSDKNSMIQYSPAAQREIHFPVSAARIYGIPVIGAEAYTGLAHFSESLGDLKPFADRAYCQGINQFILHSIVHQPDERKPGFTLGRYASHFNRHNLYWPAMKEWGEYHARIQYVLQKGTTVADVLYYPGDQLPQFNYANQSTNIPLIHHLTAINSDALKNRIEVADNKLVLNKKDSSRLLILSPHGFMNLETLKRLEELVAAGANVYSPKPENLLMLSEVKNDSKEFRQIAVKLWGEGKGIIEKQYGKGHVFSGIPVGEVLHKINLTPDFSHSSGNSVALNFIHKRIGDTDVYFVANQLDSAFQTEMKFRVSGKIPQVWDPVDGSVKKNVKYDCQNYLTSMTFRFKPYQSLFFVFKPISEANNSIKTFREYGEEIQIKDLVGEMEFKAPYPSKIKPKQFDGLIPINEAGNADIKYFSGDIIYRTKFKCPQKFLQTGQKICLNIGRFGGTARVCLNRQALPTLWYHYQDLDITGFLMSENTLEVTITNNWRNRIIGDFVQYGQLKNLWTTANVQEFLNKNSQLENSGWTGPLKIIYNK